MSGRRSHQRLDVVQWTGTLRVNRDVVVRRVASDELVVTSREPAARNERLWLQFPDADPVDAVRVQVADSQPVVLHGAVRYLLRLQVVRADAGAYAAASWSDGGVNG
jgi:hypothetical protein